MPHQSLAPARQKSASRFYSTAATLGAIASRPRPKYRHGQSSLWASYRWLALVVSVLCPVAGAVSLIAPTAASAAPVLPMIYLPIGRKR